MHRNLFIKLELAYHYLIYNTVCQKIIRLLAPFGLLVSSEDIISRVILLLQ